MLKIAIVGPESTGKSELAMQLAAHYKCIWVKEYAREFLEKLGRYYIYDDLRRIAQGQIEFENVALKENKKILFCDTTLMVIKVWSEFKYNKVDEWILNEYKNRKYDLYLLCNIDLPWQYDPLREQPYKRKELFNIYLQEVQATKSAYEIISGVAEERLENAIRGIEDYIKQKHHSI